MQTRPSPQLSPAAHAQPSSPAGHASQRVETALQRSPVSHVPLVRHAQPDEATGQATHMPSTQSPPVQEPSGAHAHPGSPAVQPPASISPPASVSPPPSSLASNPNASSVDASPGAVPPSPQPTKARTETKRTHGWKGRIVQSSVKSW
jgi:hypothetical protein